MDRYAGSGLFVLVRLSQPVPSMAVRGYPHVPRRRRGEDEFRRRFETVGFDSYRFDGPAFRAAHVRGDVPLWTVIDRDLFAFVPLDGPITPGVIDSAVCRTLRVVELMELGPDGARPPDDDVSPDVRPPEDDESPGATPPENDESPGATRAEDDELPDVRPPEDDQSPGATPPDDDAVDSPDGSRAVVD